MDEEPIVIFGPNNMGLATMGNNVRNIAKGLISGAVNSNYFNDLWKNRNKASNYSVMSMAPGKGGAIVGFAIVSRKNPYFHKIELIGAKPGGGIGKRLMEQIKENSKKAGAIAIELNSIGGAEGFYEKLGFKTIGKTMTSRGTVNTYQMFSNLRGPATFTLGKRTSPKKPTTQRRVRRTPTTRTRTTVGVRRKRSPSPVTASPVARSQARRVRQKK